MSHGRYRLRLLVFLVIASLGTTIVGLQYVGLDRYLWNRPIQVRATTAHAGGIFPNAEVTYRGVAVGRVDAVELTDDGVSIVMALEPDSEIPLERTAVPVEVDEVLQEVQDLSTALGPRGANRDGALNDLLQAGSRTLKGNGSRLNDTVTEFSRAVETASGTGDDLASTLTNLAQLTRALAASDAPVRRLASTLEAVSGSLAAQRDALVGTVDGLAVAMQEVRSLVRDSGPALTRNTAGLLDVTRTILKEEQALRETLNLAPVTLQNFIGTFDPQTSALTARIAVNGTLTTDPSLVLCQLISSNGLGRLCPIVNTLVDPVEPLLQGLPQPLGEGAELGDGVVEGSGGRR